jgi:hypothetical protein
MPFSATPLFHPMSKAFALSRIANEVPLSPIKSIFPQRALLFGSLFRPRQALSNQPVTLR